MNGRQACSPAEGGGCSPVDCDTQLPNGPNKPPAPVATAGAAAEVLQVVVKSTQSASPRGVSLDTTVGFKLGIGDARLGLPCMGWPRSTAARIEPSESKLKSLSSLVTAAQLPEDTNGRGDNPQSPLDSAGRLKVLMNAKDTGATFAALLIVFDSFTVVDAALGASWTVADVAHDVWSPS